VYVPEFQRTRLLNATVAVVSELGYKRMTAARVSARAGVSRKTFYDLFEDREDCFLAAFDQAVDELAAVVLPVYEAEGEWVARLRTGLGALLEFLDGEPALRSLVFLDALGAGSRVLECRAEVLEVLRKAVDEGRSGVRAGRMPPPLTGESVVGAAFGVIHARLLHERSGSLVALLNPLMATIVLPYRGHAAAARELSRPAPEPTAGASSGARGSSDSAPRLTGGQSVSPDFRVTFRTHLVLAAVAEAPGANNREVSDAARISDQGQISRLLARLEGRGLLRNTGGNAQGTPKAWQLTPHGEQVVRATRPHSQRRDGHTSASRVRR
jgi:AcrR family transcriptional regulator